MPRPTAPNPPARDGALRTLARLLPFARKAMPRIFAGMAASMLASIVALAIPLVLQQIVDDALDSREAGDLVWPVVLVLLLGVGEAVLIALRRWFVLTPGTMVQAEMQNTLYAKLQDLPVAFHDRWQSGQLLSRVTADLGLIRRWLSFGVVLLVVNVLTIVVGLAVLFWWSWALGTIFLVCMIPLWIFGMYFERRYSLVARRSQDQSGDLATSVEEAVHGIRVLKAFGRGRYSLERFLRQADALRGTEIEKAKAISGLWIWFLLAPDVAFALCLLGGIWLAADGQLTVGALFAFFSTATVIRFPIDSMSHLLSMTYDARTSAARVFEVLDAVNPVTDPASPVVIDEPRGRLELREVHFRYEDAPASQRDLIDGVDLVVEPGETMALVGLTGSGKTTLTALASRLYDVSDGAILLDGVDIRELSREDLRRQVAMAFEDATLFSASVRDNVLLGRPELAQPDAEAAARVVLEESLAIAQADFVHELPDGVDTRIGEEGLSLSGGQRQRLALARAVAARPSVLVLDDPLSALDVETEEKVEEALRQVLRETTALIVAHRPSTVALADRVALLEEGRITAIGRHAELLASSPHYRYVISSLESETLEAEAGFESTLPPVEHYEPIADTGTIQLPGGAR